LRDAGNARLRSCAIKESDAIKQALSSAQQILNFLSRDLAVCQLDPRLARHNNNETRAGAVVARIWQAGRLAGWQAGRLAGWQGAKARWQQHNQVNQPLPTWQPGSDCQQLAATWQRRQRPAATVVGLAAICSDWEWLGEIV
jgi:hypothetical protein